MLKIIGFIFILFSGISLIVIASLFTGIEIDNISYKNINVEKLYLKYDKKLNISTSEIIINNQTTNKKIKMKTNFTLDYDNELFVFDIKNFQLKDTDIDFKGLVYLDLEQIDLENSTQLMLEDVVVVFDKKMKQIKSQRVFLNYQNDIINLSFEKPYYGNIDISDTTVSYLLQKNVLKLYLKTKKPF